MQRARPFQVVGQPAQEDVPLAACIGDPLQDVVAGLLQRLTHQVGTGGELSSSQLRPHHSRTNGNSSGRPSNHRSSAGLWSLGTSRSQRSGWWRMAVRVSRDTACRSARTAPGLIGAQYR